MLATRQQTNRIANCVTDQRESEQTRMVTDWGDKNLTLKCSAQAARAREGESELDCCSLWARTGAFYT
jgi:hypothetical protein